MKPSVLLIDDEPSVIFGYKKFLEKAGYATSEAGTLAEGRAKVEARRYDAVLLDMKLPDGNGVDFVPDIRALYPDIAIVIITGVGDVPAAVDALKKGADNFLTKPVDMGELDVFLRKSVEVSGLRRGDMARKRLEKKRQPFFGKSPEAVSLLEYAQLAADNDSTVLIYGETGVGKGVLARWIHERSDRSGKPFVEVNCSSLRGDLLSSELFGHAKGSFTSAVSDREGLVEVADRGTLFLDEIGDMDMAVQAQFLKVIEEKSYRRVGETNVRHSDFRLICATNRDLQKEAGEGVFRKDLFFRINVLPLSIDPLARGVSDIPDLAAYFLEGMGLEAGGLDPSVMQLFTSYSWPGNIREMKNVLERAVLLARGEPLALKHFPGISPASGTALTASSGGVKSLHDVEEEYIASVIEQCGGDMHRASALLGVSRATLYRKMKRLKD